MPPTTSYSRLELYEKCPRKYQHKYIHHTPAESVMSAPLLLGTLAHGALEELLDPETQTADPAEAFGLYMPSWMESAGLPVEMMGELFLFAQDYARVLLRASPSYLGGDAIRNKDGSPPKDLENYPPGSWTTALRAQGLSSRKLDLDNTAGTESAVFRDCSVAHLVGLAYAMVLGLPRPDWMAKTLWVERGFSVPTGDKLKDPVPFPGREDLHLQAYLDWVVETTDGRMAVIDHKTSKDCPSEADVAQHTQLNLYAWLLYTATGRYPELIGINHLRSQTLVMASTDPAVTRDVVAHLVDVQKSIETGVFPRRPPTSYNSPCLRRDYRTREVKELCPYLAHCWPEYTDSLRQEGVEVPSSDI